ncbi:helix-turn-helix domain-containing protein [Mucilaginibacter agri]|uniref:Helix-turn-helix domain-containing protein n=1 Tax=Mucilaginibacter agri TaxID=2695265 RepID=A0A965ZEU2_9SPHI|nr:helix-turn-helix domain-containing protein [Mucilaginibacter agri]NCD68684.1 helix-turn-helix domain-containing protein [Mucilaginibacter agri]
MTLNLSEILLLLLIFQLLFVSAFLFTLQSNKKISNAILGLLFLFIALSLIDNFCIKTNVGYQHPNWVIWSSSFPLLYGPLLYAYTQSLLYRNFKTDWRLFMHLSPFLVLFIASYTNYIIQPGDVKLGILHAINSHHIEGSLYTVSAVAFIYFLLYVNKAFKIIRRYKAEALNNFSDPQQVNLNWLSSTLVFFILLFILSIVNNVLEASSQKAFYSITLILIILAMLLFINSVLFKALRRPEIFKGINSEDLQLQSKTKTAPVVDRSAGLTALASYMQTEKPYLNPDLTVEILARSVKMRPKELSLMINEDLGQNFFDHVNRYRVEEAKRLLADRHSNLTVLEVLYRVGFNSKSSFNVLFKKYTGLTPTEFRNQ